MTSKGLERINFKYMKKLIEKIKTKFSRKPLLVIPAVSSSTDLNHKYSIEEQNLFLFFLCGGKILK